MNSTKWALTPPKITRPAPQGVLARTGVFRVLDRTRQPLVWVMAPPGAGKTTLISHYLEQRCRKHLWYQVEAGDNDVADLFHYLTLAAKPAVRRTHKPLPRYAPEYLPDIEAFFRLFFRALFARLSAPTTLVFDDYQEIAGDAAFHRALCAALKQMPAGHQLIVISRDAPPPAFARVEAQRQMAYLDWQLLKLTREEARRLAKVHRRPLPGGAQERLHALCEGWVTGFLLLLEQASQSRSNALDQPNSLPAVVADYFELQVFACAPPELQQFWLSTAYLPTLTKATALAVSAIENAPALIDTLSRRHFFIQQHGSSGAAYQYHALLQEFLRGKLELIYSRSDRMQLMQRSAAALQTQGDHEAAFKLFCGAGDWESATQLLLAHAPVFLTQGRWQTLHQSIVSLPQSLVDGNAWLLYWQSVCLAQTDPVGNSQMLAKAYGAFVQSADVVGQALTAAAVLAGNYMEWGNFEQRGRWFRILEGILAQRPAFSSPSAELRAWSALLLAFAHEQGEHPFATECAERVLQLCRSPLPVAERLTGATYLLFYLTQVAGVAHTREIVQEFSPLSMSNEVSPVQRAGWDWTQALSFILSGDLNSSLQLIASAQRLLAEADLPYLLAALRLLESWCLLTESRIEPARRLLDRLAAAIDRARPNDVALYYCLRSWLACRDGEWHMAIEHAERSMGITRQLASVSPWVCSFSNYSLALAECDRLDEASAAVDEATQVRIGAKGINRFTALLFNADVLRRRGEDHRFREVMAEAFSIGRRLGLLNCLVWIPTMMSRLCAAALASGIEIEYVERLIRRRELAPPEIGIETWPWPVRIYTLGRFDVVIQGERLKPAGKAQRRPLELLKALIALGGRKIPAERLAGELWPNAEGDAAYQALKISLHRLRRLLGSEERVRVENSEVTLDAQQVWVDVWTFERGCSEMTAKTTDAALLERTANRILPLYQGAFLGADTGAWALAPRERLRSKYLRALMRVGEAQQQCGQWQQAAHWYERGIDVEPIAEELYLQLIRCYQHLQRRAEVLTVYRRCMATLSSLQLKPTRRLQALAEELRKPD